MDRKPSKGKREQKLKWRYVKPKRKDIRKAAAEKRAAELAELKFIHTGMVRDDNPVKKQIVARQVRRFLRDLKPKGAVRIALEKFLGKNAQPIELKPIEQFNQTKMRTVNRIRQFDYTAKRDLVPTSRDLARAVLTAIENTGARSIWVRLWDYKNRMLQWRALQVEPLTNLENLTNMLDNIEAYVGTVIEGSDPDNTNIGDEGYALDTTIFKASGIHSTGGCNNSSRVREKIIGGHQCVSYRSTNDNCLIQAFKQITKRVERCDTIRKHLAIAKGPIALCDIPKIEEYFKIKCFVNTPSGSVYGDVDAPAQLMLEDEHYWNIEEHKPKIVAVKKRKVKTAKVEAEIQVWVYDCETHYDEKDLYAYSCACITGYGENMRVFYEVGRDCMAHLEEWLRINADHDKRNILVGFNNSKFDDYLLIPHLVNSALIKPNGVFMANGATLKVTFGSFHTIDMCRFLNTSLASACRAFNCSELKGFCDHNAIQQKFYELKTLHGDGAHEVFYDWIREQPEMRQYNIQDCVSLRELFEKFDTAVHNLIGLRFYDNMTISQMGLKAFHKTEASKLVKNPATLARWTFIRSAIVAGRSEIFQRALCTEEMASLDVKSLYPYAMRACEFPIGEEIETPAYVENKLGVYNVIIKKQPEPRKTNMNITPFRDSEGKNALDWKTREEIRCVLCSVDIQTHIDSGSDIEILNGVYWEESAHVFAEYVEPLEKEKSRQDGLKDARDESYNQALREAIKLLLNSLSGKVLQNRHDEEVIISVSADQTEKFAKEHNNVIAPRIIEGCNAVMLHGNKKKNPYKQQHAKPCHLGVFIYAWSRRHMYLSALGRIEDKYCTDTDSVHIPKRILEQYKHETPGFGRLFMGNEFGHYENELEFVTKRAYYIAPKVYGLFGHKRGDETIPVRKVRFKGVRANDKLFEGDDDDIKAFRALSTEQQLERYLQLSPALTEDLYINMLNNTPVNVMTSQIIRKPFGEHGSTAFGLQQRFMIKTIV